MNHDLNSLIEATKNMKPKHLHIFMDYLLHPNSTLEEIGKGHGVSKQMVSYVTKKICIRQVQIYSNLV